MGAKAYNTMANAMKKPACASNYVNKYRQLAAYDSFVVQFIEEVD